jgi:N-acetylglucosaminyl-diphospho-decaprenol L-rhamnosyltransferase
VTGVAVVVGNWQGEQLLSECLASIAGQTLAPEEVFVVDASSTDASVAVAEAGGARVLVRSNLGLGHLYNEGARAAASSYVLCINNDVALERRCIELLAAELSSDDRRFAADPRQLDWRGERLVHGRARLARGPLLRQPLPGFRLDLAVPSATVVPTVSANGGAMLVRRERLLELGGFDETMFMDFEDLDLCWRAWLRGWPSVYVPQAVVRHRIGAVTSSAVLNRRLVSSHHNLLRFALKCLPRRDAGRVLLGELLRLPRHPRLIAPALAAVARELPEIARARRATRPSTEFTRWVLEGMPV